MRGIDGSHEMHADLAARRRLLLLAYRRYMEADRCWSVAIEDMKTWFPTEGASRLSRIGHPGSPIRLLYEQREKAISRLETARIKLEVGKRRLAEQRGRTGTRTILLLTAASD